MSWLDFYDHCTHDDSSLNQVHLCLSGALQDISSMKMRSRTSSSQVIVISIASWTAALGLYPTWSSCVYWFWPIPDSRLLILPADFCTYLLVYTVLTIPGPSLRPGFPCRTKISIGSFLLDLEELLTGWSSLIWLRLYKPSSATYSPLCFRSAHGS